MKYVSPTKADTHQVEALRRVRARPRSPSSADVFAWLMEMGTGKSKVILDEWQDAVGAGTLQNLMVVAPAGSYRNWFEDKSEDQQSEIRKHLDPRLLKSAIVAPWETGGGVEAQRRLEFALRPTDRPRLTFMNVEALSTVERARDFMSSFLESGETMLAVDESTTIKGGSKRTKAILKMAPTATARRIATGLITPRSPMDLFHQFAFLDWRILGYQSFYAFRARYAVMRRVDFGGRKFDMIVGFRNLEELQRKIAPYSYRVLKSDCLDLEPKTYESRDVELTEEQRKLYRELRDYATAELDNERYVTTTSVLTQITRLQQIACGYTRDDEGDVHDVPSNRIGVMLDVLRDHEGKAVIWTTSVHLLHKIYRAIEKEFGDASCAAFWGGNKNTRGEDERRFLGDRGCRFLVATEDAGARGNTWNAATLVVYFDNDYDLELRSQSEDRCHRRGQENKVTYVDLIARNTVDVKIIRALRRKIDMATIITGENYREWLI